MSMVTVNLINSHIYFVQSDSWTCLLWCYILNSIPIYRNPNSMETVNLTISHICVAVRGSCFYLRTHPPPSTYPPFILDTQKQKGCSSLFKAYWIGREKVQFKERRLVACLFKGRKALQPLPLTRCHCLYNIYISFNQTNNMQNRGQLFSVHIVVCVCNLIIFFCYATSFD